MATPEGPQLIEGALIHRRVAWRSRRAATARAWLLRGPIAAGAAHLRGAVAPKLEGGPMRSAKPLTVDGDTCTIVGVMPAGFHVPGQLNDQVWVRPILEQPTEARPVLPDGRCATCAPSVSREQAEVRLTTAIKPVMREAVRGQGPQPGAYGFRSVKETLTGEVRETLWLTFAAVGLVHASSRSPTSPTCCSRGGTVRARELAGPRIARRRARTPRAATARRVGVARTGGRQPGTGARLHLRPGRSRRRRDRDARPSSRRSRCGDGDLRHRDEESRRGCSPASSPCFGCPGSGSASGSGRQDGRLLMACGMGTHAACSSWRRSR